VRRTLICPKCGADNLGWRSRCLECGEKLHPEDDKLPSFESSNAVTFLPFIIGFLGTGALAFLVILNYGLSSGGIPIFVYGLLAVPVAGLVLCWKWPRVGGVLLILASLFPIAGMLVAGIQSRDIPSMLIWLGLALPLLASGISLIIWSSKG